MAKLSIVAGATSQSINVFIQDNTSTTGAGLTAVAPAGGSLLTGTIAYYSFSGANAASVAISLSVLATVGAAWSSAGIVTIDDTHMPGVVRLDLPNAVLAAAKGRSVTVILSGGTHMAPCVLEIELTAWDNQDGVRGALTALPNAAANAAGGLPVSIAGALDMDDIGADVDAIQTSTAGLTYTVSNQVDVNVKSVAGTASAGTAGYVAPDWSAIHAPTTTVDLSGTTIKNVDNAIAAVTTVTNLTNAPTAGDFTATMKTSIGTAVAASAVASVTAAVATTSNIKTNQALAKFQFLMTDSTLHNPKTGLTVTCTRSIDGGAFGAGTLANITEISNGTYTVDFGAGDLNGKVIVLQATAASADTTFERIVTQP